VLSALMSNTATAALLIPVALRIDPTPVSVLLVALATSLGCPFVVSTPPNALAGRLGATAGDLARPGLLLLVGGVILLAVTGPTMLGLFGVR
jgi:sodium-dependent dicarboxylate transporter 2/3/5